MGMYTELIIGCALKESTPIEVINTIQWMRTNTEPNGPEPANLPKGERVSWMFQSGGSYYFGSPSPVVEFTKDSQGFYRFSGRFNIKNYDNEIESFLEWLEPYVEQGSGNRDMWAITMYEEQDEPTIYYLKEKDEN